MANISQIAQLLYKYLQGSLTHGEEQELQQWANQHFSNRELLESLNNEEELKEKLWQHLPENRQALRNRIFEKVLNKTRETDKHETNTLNIRKTNIWKWMAAATLIFAAATAWYLSGKSPGTQQAVVEKKTNIHYDAAPGRTGALLTTSNGNSILLDGASNGIITYEGTAVVKLENGQLKYNGITKKDTSISWNTVSTNNGRQFTVQLSDGSKVWLNAGSSIRYPVEFGEHERKVFLTGEAYFEVAAKPAQPFTVSAEGSTIEVLGTSFNINSYTDEPSLKATLLKGSIRISKNSNSQILKPGQQALVNENITVKEKTDTTQVIAWKNGFFNLNGISIEELMRQLSRWYDIEVGMEGGLPQKQFWGEIYRGEKLSSVLMFLEKSGIHFKMENNGKKLVLTK